MVGRYISYISYISPRRILYLLITLICLSSIVLSGLSVFLCNIYYSDANREASLGWLGISLAGISLFLVCIVGLRGTHLVNLELLLTYFWSITVFLSALTLGIVSCFNSYIYIRIWLRHSWQDPSFDQMRMYFCEPVETAMGKCRAPIDVGDIIQWCLVNYNATDCQPIRKSAVQRAEKLAQSLTLSLGLVGIINLGLILLSIYVCYRIVTAPVITQSMNDIINYLLFIPMGGCVGMAIYLGQYSFLPYYSGLSKINIGLAVAQLTALPLGIAAGRLKSQIMITCYVVLIMLITFGFIAVGSVSLIYSGLIGQTFEPTS
jgi:hypothetical protein